MSKQGTPAGATFNGAMEALEDKFENRFTAIDGKFAAMDCKIDAGFARFDESFKTMMTLMPRMSL
jgi:flagellar capping protein FliD